MYKWRQVKCPLCEHIFMWREESYTGSSSDVYKRKGIDEELESHVVQNVILRWLLRAAF